MVKNVNVGAMGKKTMMKDINMVYYNDDEDSGERQHG